MFSISPRATCSAVAFACIALAAGCKKEAPAAPAAAAAPAAPAAGAAASGALPRAKELVDKMTGEIAKRIDEVEAAGNDQARIRTIGEDLKRALEGTRTEGEELVKKLNEAEKKELDAYAKEKIQPIYGRLMSVMMKVQMASRPLPGSPTPTAGQPELAPPPAAATAAVAP